MITEFTVRTKEKREVIDITSKVEDIVKKSGLAEGFALVFAPHATAGVIVNEAEANLERDFVSFFERIVPKEKWAHDRIDDNAEAHLASALFGQGKVLPITNSRLLRGTWQQILLCEFDGPRERRVVVVCK